MTVYVDDMRMRHTVGTLDRIWSHMIADSPAELGAMARRLKLKEAWRQKAGHWHEHFDVTDAVRDQAIALGAVPVSAFHTPVLSLRIYERRVAAQFVSDALPGLEDEPEGPLLPPLPPGPQASLDSLSQSWGRTPWPEGHYLVPYLSK